MIIPKSISARHNTAAELTLECHATLGTTATYSNSTPFAWSSAQTIVSGQGATANIFGAGPVKYTISGGSARLVTGIQSSQVDFGIELSKKSSDSDVYLSWIGIMKRQPKFTFTTEDGELITEIGDGQSVSAFASYFRAFTNFGQRVAAATTSHVSVAATAGVIRPVRENMGFGKVVEGNFEFVPALNSTLLTISAAAAIPTT